MTALLVILLATIGLAVRAVSYRGQWSAADSEIKEMDLVDACARTFVLVLLALLGLLALGMMYGNVLGAANTSP
jgi:ABC-type Fe3+ transport system permease subunit